MRKNYMAGVAKLLGVKLGEIFKISADNRTGNLYYQLTEENGILYSYSKDNINWKRGMDMILLDLLLGDIRIVKLPSKSQKGET